MSKYTASNRRIAQNTMLLYIRMLLIMLVSLYMSRVVLKILGVTDFGIYNIVGGVVSIFAFLNSALGSSTQRYISYALGEGNIVKLKTIFTSSVIIHVFVALLILLLSETIGLWFFYHKLVIPEERLGAAFWAYQASTLTCIINVISVPYNSLIIAHEKMDAYAYISIIEVMLKLLLVFLITVLPFDKLVVYSVLILSVSIITRYIYQLYCRRKFVEAKLVRIEDWRQFKGMLTFSSWTLVGMFAWVCHSQGLNILLNMFFGPIVNAARAIADQVNSAIMQLINNFQLAAKPQIIKCYANNDINKANNLVGNMSLFSSYLLILCMIPVSLNIDYLLSVWLGEYPPMAPVFINIILIQSLSQATVAPVIMISHATGKMKMPNITGGITYMLTIPICYVLLRNGATAEEAVLASLIPVILKSVWDVLYAKKYTGFSMSKFYRTVYFKVFLIAGVVYYFMFLIKKYFIGDGLCEVLFLSFLSMSITLVVVYAIGLQQNQRAIINSFVRDKFKKIYVCRK